MSGKGSSRRPAAVPRETVDANYERTFRVGPTTTLTPRELFGDAWDGKEPGPTTMLRVSRVDATTITFDATPSGRYDPADVRSGGSVFDCFADDQSLPSGRADAEA